MSIMPSVALGLEPPPLPPVTTLEDLRVRRPEKPLELIEGILHKGCKGVLAATSKSNKSWCLIDLAVSVVSGGAWLGRRCEQAQVLYLNFELQEWVIWERIEAVARAKGCEFDAKSLHVWQLRDHPGDISVLRPGLMRQIVRNEYGLIILDPAYKLLGERDENSNGDITSLMNEFGRISSRSGAAIMVAHHFAKGDPSAKEAIDRTSGAGAWARDPDALIVLTPHEETDCYTVTTILRNMPILRPFVVEWDFPMLRVAHELNPDELKRRGGRKKVLTDYEFGRLLVGDRPASLAVIVNAAQAYGMSDRSVRRYLSRLVEAGLVATGSGMYWRRGKRVES